MKNTLDRRTWLRATSALGLGLAWAGPFTLVGCDRQRELMRVHLGLFPRAGEEIGAPVFQGLLLLLVDHMESLGGLTVLPWPPPESPRDARSRACFMRVTFSLGKSTLAFDVDISYANAMKLEPRSSGPLSPSAAMAWFTQNIPFRFQRSPASGLCPSDPGLFRPLLEALAQEDQEEMAEPLMAFSGDLIRRSPECATAHFFQANQLYNELLRHPLDQESQWKAFRAYRAGLELVPHHPRGVEGMSQLQADAGLHRDALTLLEAAIGQHPQVPRLFRSLCYVARTSGLLELARRSMERVNQLTLGRADLMGENTYLYLGDFKTFRSNCQIQGVGRDARTHFYLGYLALVDGDRTGAAAAFRAALKVPGGWFGFEELSGIYLHSLEGRPAEAAVLLQSVTKRRAGLRAPDGEFTFKLAEVAAFLGDLHQAMELGEMAFTQGFGCTRWYEQSPLFAPVRGTAHWEVLKQHLKERQALLESRFPPRRFKL